MPADLTTPAVVSAPPAAGRRVRQTLPEYRNTDVHHALYLPADWNPHRRFPVIVEYAGNGKFHNSFGDVSEGTVEGSNLGYGISGGRGFIWLCLPYVSAAGTDNQIVWWGDPARTAEYARKAVRLVCRRYGGDRKAVILAGFSRGAIACNFIGLRDDKTAKLWRAFIAYSQYDGVVRWRYAGSDRASAISRLQRLRGRPVFVIQEASVVATREFIASSGVKAPFRFVTLGFRNHNDTWVLRDVPERKELRDWLDQVMRK